MNLKKFEGVIGYAFKNRKLLLEALTHRSYVNENRTHETEHYERLEFLGDAVLELIVTDFLFTEFAGKHEGELTRMRSLLVNRERLALAAEAVGLNRFLLFSRGEAKDMKGRKTILASSFEALVAAIYKDGGATPALRFTTRFLLSKVNPSELETVDAKSLLQQIAQERVGITPRYELISENGPDHDKRFLMGCYLGSNLASEGDGASKQEAEQKAAENALAVYDEKTAK